MSAVKHSIIDYSQFVKNYVHVITKGFVYLLNDFFKFWPVGHGILPLETIFSPPPPCAFPQYFHSLYVSCDDSESKSLKWWWQTKEYIDIEQGKNAGASFESCVMKKKVWKVYISHTQQARRLLVDMILMLIAVLWEITEVARREQKAKTFHHSLVSPVYVPKNLLLNP